MPYSKYDDLIEHMINLFATYAFEASMKYQKISDAVNEKIKKDITSFFEKSHGCVDDLAFCNEMQSARMAMLLYLKSMAAKNALLYFLRIKQDAEEKKASLDSLLAIREMEKKLVLDSIANHHKRSLEESENQSRETAKKIRELEESLARINKEIFSLQEKRKQLIEEYDAILMVIEKLSLPAKPDEAEFNASTKLDLSEMLGEKEVTVFREKGISLVIEVRHEKIKEDLRQFVLDKKYKGEVDSVSERQNFLQSSVKTRTEEKIQEKLKEANIPNNRDFFEQDSNSKKLKDYHKTMGEKIISREYFEKGIEKQTEILDCTNKIEKLTVIKQNHEVELAAERQKSEEIKSDKIKLKKQYEDFRSTIEGLDFELKPQPPQQKRADSPAVDSNNPEEEKPIQKKPASDSLKKDNPNSQDEELDGSPKPRFGC